MAMSYAYIGQVEAILHMHVGHLCIPFKGTVPMIDLCIHFVHWFVGGRPCLYSVLHLEAGRANTGLGAALELTPL
jgi:hypothetical protein